MDSGEYRSYLMSEDWKERRLELLEEADNICEECGGIATNLHHLRYDNLGEEELDVDVVALCTSCHKERHGNKEDMGGYGDYGN